MAQDRGERADMFRQYLKPAMNRSNLTVLTGAKTLKIETEQHSGKPAARAVKFSTKGPAGQVHTGGQRPGTCTAHASRCAGCDTVLLCSFCHMT